MTVSMINILDERLNGVDLRLQTVEKLTKDIHGTVQKYKAKGGSASEKILTDRFEAMVTENNKFQEVMRQRMLEIGNVIDLKCKKIVTTLFDSKMLKLENEIKEQNENNPPGTTNANKKPLNSTNKPANNLKQSQGSYTVRNETLVLKKCLDETVKVVEKVRGDN